MAAQVVVTGGRVVMVLALPARVLEQVDLVRMVCQAVRLPVRQAVLLRVGLQAAPDLVHLHQV